MFGRIKKERKVECAVCNENLSSKDAYVSYLKINGHVGLHFLHRECLHKLMKLENKHAKAGMLPKKIKN